MTLTDSGFDESAGQDGADVLQIDAALDRLRAESPCLAELVTPRFFAGLSIEDAARALEISPATAKRDWAFARAWLHKHMTAADTP